MNGNRIKYFRELNNHKREWLAKELGLTATHIARIENNLTGLTVERLHQIAVLLKVSIFDLFESEYIQNLEPMNYEKYGPIESSFIRYLVRQNEIQEAKYEALVKMNEQLMENMLTLSSHFKTMMEHTGKLDAVSKKKTK
jgi:transcriptional regulator with XRE-family HTH domain